MRKFVLLLLLLPVAPVAAHAQGALPSAAEIAAAQPAAIRVMAERIAQAVGGDRERATSELLAAAFAAEHRHSPRAKCRRS